jgi:nucleoside-triphosphatase
MSHQKLLITGRPGIGKTTLIRKVSAGLPASSGVAGFYTEEMRQGGRRVGFRLVSLAGGDRVLSHVDIRGPRVGRYGVDIPGFEAFLAGLSLESAPLVTVDEIGRMECLSARFRELIAVLLRSDCAVLASIALRGTPFIESLKRLSGVELIRIDEQTRDALEGRLLARLREGAG